MHGHDTLLMRKMITLLSVFPDCLIPKTFEPFNPTIVKIHELDGPTMPVFERIAFRLSKQSPKIGGDRNFLIFWHGTTAHKISVAFYRQHNMTEIYPSIFSQLKGKDPVTGFPFFKFSADLESFFTMLYGALQAWGREVSEVLGLEANPRALFFPILADKAISEYPELELTKQLSSLRKSAWFDYLNKTRNRIEHGAIPLYRVQSRKLLYLADRQWPIETVASFDNKLEVIAYTSSLLTTCANAIEKNARELEHLLFDSS